MTPMLIAIASGESLWPKHTGHASAARGAASSTIVREQGPHAATSASSSAETPRRRRPGSAPAASDTAATAHVPDIVLQPVLPRRPGREERGEHDRQRDEQQVKRTQRHVSAPRVRPRRAATCRRRRVPIVRADRIHRREQRHEHQHDEEGDRQEQRPVDPLLLVIQVHEHGGDHRPLDARDDERDGDRHRHGEVHLVRPRP